nr:DivIVA domain-containing protein [Nocardioides perillae]
MSAADLRRVRFPLAVRGYRMAEVDALLDRLADQLAGQPDTAPPPHPPSGDDHDPSRPT